MKANRYLAKDMEKLGDHLVQGKFINFSLSARRITPTRIFSATEALAITEAPTPRTLPGFMEVPSPGATDHIVPLLAILPNSDFLASSC